MYPKRSGRNRFPIPAEKLEPRRLLSNTPFTADGTPWEITSTGTSWVEAENFDYGGKGVAYSTTATSNQGGKYRTGDDIGIEGPNADTGNTYNVGYVNAGQWMKYTIHVDVAGIYVIDLRASNANATTCTTHLTFNNSAGTVTSGEISIPTTTGGWGGYTDHTMVSVNLSAGTQVMTLYDDTSGCNFDYVSLTPQAIFGQSETAYDPTVVDSTTGVQRSLPTYLPAFGAAQIESEDFDTGGQAGGATGVESGGYYWLDSSKYTATYPYTATAYRPTDTIDMADSGTGIVTTNWEGGDWAQYTVYSATNTLPVTPVNTTPSYQAVTEPLIYQFLLTYSNSSAISSSFAIDDTSTNPSTGLASLTQLATLSLPGTSGNYSTISATITLPRDGTNILRLVDADTSGANSHVNVDYFKLINATTTGNNNVPWEVSGSGTATQIPASDVDAAPGSAIYPSGTSPTIAPTGDGTGGGSDIKNLTASDAVTYTINTDLSSQYNVSLRVLNTASTPATLQVTFDSGAAFGATPDPVVFSFTVPVSSSYQTITTATDISQNPQLTNNYVEIQAGTQKMQVMVVSGTIDFHWVQLSNITAVAVDYPAANQLGSYAAQPPDAALNSVGDLFDRVYNTNYYWINPPANAPVPTNDWWTNLLVSQFAGDMYAYPQKINDSASGVAISSFNGYGTNSAGNTIIETGQQSIVIGASGTTFTDDALVDYGDWTVHYRMQTADSAYMDVTMGRGLPYTWFQFSSLSPTITLHTGSDANQNAFLLYNSTGGMLSGTFTTDHFRVDTGAQQLAVFAPAGTVFTDSNGVLTVSFASGAAKYLVTAVLPDSSNSTLNTFYQNAYSIPEQVGSTQSSTYTWTYSPIAGTVTTHWSLNLVAIDPNNPPATLSTIQGWLPIDYTNGATGPVMLTNASSGVAYYPSLNGNIEMSVGSSFNVVQTTDGINFELALPQTIEAPAEPYDPTNPSTTMVSTDYSPQQMLSYIKTYISQNTNTAATASAGTTILNYGTDTYWGGKPLQEYAEFALMCKQIGDVTDYNIFLSNLTTFMTDWFTYTPGETAHYFAYYPGTHALIGFDPSYGSENFTDNMFHYGYFTAAAGVLAMLNPTWASEYGQMAKMVAMQYANWLHPGDAPDVTDPNATSLPFLRTFEPWVGHSYAGGTSSAGGNNEESSSEAIQSWLGIALLGQALNDPAMTAAGMMGYTMESKAVQEQWFNQAPGAPNTYGLAFPSTYAGAGQSAAYSNVAINFDGGKNYASYFGANPEYILGIEALPLWPSLDVLGENAAAAAAATQSMLNERVVFYKNAADNTFASFESGGENDWLNIALGFQSQYDPQATALQYARMIAQQTPTGVTGSTGLYYFQDHSDQTYGLRNWNEHLSLPLGGVYSHGADSTTMSNTTTYMVYNPGSTSTTVYVYNNTGDVVLDSFTAVPGYNVVTRSASSSAAPPIISTGASVNPATVTGTTAQLSVLANDELQTEPNITYTWSVSSGPAGANPVFSPNGTNALKNATVTFNRAGTYTLELTAADSDGLSVITYVNVVVQSVLTAFTISPASATVFANSTQTFAAAGTDQFGQAVTSSAVNWSATSGTISSSGSYKAPGGAGTATITGTSGTGTASTMVTIISGPSTLNATMHSETELDLTWTGASGTVLGYNIYRGTTPGGESTTPINSAPVTTTSYKDTTVLPYTDYFYTVEAVTAASTSSPTDEASSNTSIDLALNKPTTTPGGDQYAASQAVDGNSNTRWSSAFADPGYIYVNLGQIYNISEVKLNWENAAGENYLIQVSNNASSWTTVATVTRNTTAGWKVYSSLNTSGQYVRMYGTMRDTPYGYSLWDFNVYGPAPAAQLSLSGSNYLELDSATPGQLDVWSGTTKSGVPTNTYKLSQITTIVDAATAASDQLTVDFTNGNPLGGIVSGASFVGIAGGSNGLVIVGDNAGDSYQLSAGTLTVNSVPISFTNAATVTIDAGNGNDSYRQNAAPGAVVRYDGGTGTDLVVMNAGAGTLTLTAPAGAGSPALNLSSLSIGAGDAVSFVSSAAHAGHSVLVVGNLSLGGTTGDWTSTLDLTSNDLELQSTGLWARTFDQIARRAVFSSTATGLMTLGMLNNDNGMGQPIFSSMMPFDDLNPLDGWLLVKYTYFGDTDLNGKVDGSDYSRIDSGYAMHATGWQSGDLNFDGVVDGSDYTLMDNAFNTQGAPVPTAEVASLIATKPLAAVFSGNNISIDSILEEKKSKSARKSCWSIIEDR
jgi:endoglucanase Acf2